MRSKFTKLHLALACAGLCSLSASMAQAAEIDLAATADATLLGGTNNAAANDTVGVPGFFVGTDSNKSPKHGLVSFDVADNIPAGSTITSVSLQLTVGQVAGSGGQPGATGYGASGVGAGYTISLYNETQAWGPPSYSVGATTFNGHGQGNPANNGEATWNDAFYNSNSALATPWANSAGGNWSSSLTDLADMHVASATYNDTETWSSTPNLVAEVQGWLDSPTSNYGFLLKNADETDGQSFLAFYGAQGAANYDASPAYLASNGIATVGAPDLIVDYTTAAPEPSSAVILLLGAPLLLLRRKSRVISADISI